ERVVVVGKRGAQAQHEHGDHGEQKQTSAPARGTAWRRRPVDDDVGTAAGMFVHGSAFSRDYMRPREGLAVIGRSSVAARFARSSALRASPRTAPCPRPP